MPLFHLLYVSSATAPFSAVDLVTLLERSRTKNHEAGISGMLLYRDGNFMQVLEGDEPVVHTVHNRISSDPRHRGLIVLLKGQIEKRTFSSWSMGFRNLDSADVKKTPGYSEFMNVDWRSGEMLAEPARALKLLTVFRDSMR
ncbi:MAG TPA: BLUF domain-containing protein [Opitutaceae bacterium]|nr:BLUF domain-containing protein [Opitutaceae bacterium]